MCADVVDDVGDLRVAHHVSDRRHGFQPTEATTAIAALSHDKRGSSVERSINARHAEKIVHDAIARDKLILAFLPVVVPIGITGLFSCADREIENHHTDI
jgi:hypothetical protein